MAKRIIYTDKAFADIDRIIDFNNFRNKSNQYSRKLLSLLKKRLLLLSKQPLSGINTNEEDQLVLIWDSYYIFYKINDSSIEVTSIYHQKEDVSR